VNRFDFRLARVLDFRQKQLEAADQVLRRLVAEQEGWRGQKEALGARYLAEEAALRIAVAPRPGELAALSAYRRHVRLEQAKLDRLIFECGRRVEKQRAEVLEARRRFRLLEKLHDKSKRNWEAAFAKEIDSLAEDSFLARWPRQSGAAREAEGADPLM